MKRGLSVTKRIVAMLLVMVLIIAVPINVSGGWLEDQLAKDSLENGVQYKDGRMHIDKKDYNDSLDGTFTFGSNLWHTRYFDGEVQLPFREMWTKDVGGKAMGQPVITDEFIILTVEDSLMSMRRDTGEIIVQKEDAEGGDRLKVQLESGLKPIYASPFYLSNKSGWLKTPQFNDPSIANRTSKDSFDRIYVATRDGYLYCYQIGQSGKLIMDPYWAHFNGASYPDNNYSNKAGGFDTHTGSKGIVSSPIMVMDHTKNIPVIIVATDNGKIYAVDAVTGMGVSAWQLDKSDIFSSPIAYRRFDKETGEEFYSNFAIGIEDEADNQKNGHIAGFYASDLGLWKINGLTEEKYRGEGVPTNRIPTSIGIVEKKVGNDMQYIFMYSDDIGNIYGYNEFTEEIIFKIDKFAGDVSLNTPTIIQNKDGDKVYAIFTLSKDKYNHKGKLVCIDVNHAIEEANNTGGDPDNAVYWETNSNDFSGVAYSGSSAIAMLNMKDEKSQAIVIAVDQGNNKNKNNLRAYYVDVREGNQPVPVEGAFQNSEGLASTGLFIPGGVYGEPAFMANYDKTNKVFDGGFLIVTSGSGNVHAFKYEPINNLKISEFYKKTEAAEADYSFENGEEIIVSATIENQSGIALEDVEFDLTFDKGYFGQEPKLLAYTVYRNGLESVNGEIAVNDSIEVYGNHEIIVEEKDEFGDMKDILKGYEKGYFNFKSDMGQQGVRVEFKLQVPENYASNSLELFVRTNIGNPPSLLETTYEDNDALLELRNAQYDFAIRNMYVPDLRTGEKAFIRFDVANDSEKDWEGSNLYLSTRIKDSSGTTIKYERKPFEDFTYDYKLEAATSRRVSSFMTLPSSVKDGERLTATAFIDCDDNISEESENNNISSRYFDVDNDADICKGNVLEVDESKWFSRGEDESWEDHNGGVLTDSYSITTRSGNKEDGYEYYTTYYRKYTYTSNLKMVVKTSKTKLKSGYGFVVEAYCEVTTDQDDKSGIEPCNEVWTFANGLAYDMEKVDDGDGNPYTTKFILPKNNESKFEERKVFVPLDYQDGLFNVRVCTGNVAGTGGQMYASKAFDVEIEGHMYEDINTRPTE